MCRITLLTAIAIAGSTLLGAEQGTALNGNAKPRAADELARRTDVHVAWTASDARQKAESFLESYHAHREALTSMQQCRTCHGGSAVGWLNRAAVELHPKGPWIGVSVAPADGVLRSQLRLPEGTGVVVTQLVPDGPAQRAGVEVDDVLLSVNGKPVAGGDDLDKILQAVSPEGPALTLKLLRAGETLEKQVTPDAEDVATFLDAVVAQRSPTFRIGVHVTDPDQTLRRQLRLGDGGLVVTEVKAKSPADLAGVKAGDILLSINAKRLTSQEQLVNAVREAGETPVELELLRSGVALQVNVTPAKEQVSALATEYLPLEHVDGDLGRARDLMLVYPNAARVVVRDALSTQPAAEPAARLEQMTLQLEELRQAVDALRQELGRKDVEKAERPD